MAKKLKIAANGQGEKMKRKAYEKELRKLQVKLPKRADKHSYDDTSSIKDRRFVAIRY